MRRLLDAETMRVMKACVSTGLPLVYSVQLDVCDWLMRQFLVHVDWCYWLGYVNCFELVVVITCYSSTPSNRLRGCADRIETTGSKLEHNWCYDLKRQTSNKLTIFTLLMIEIETSHI